MKNKYRKYLQQYLANANALNMEFSEFLASKLNITENDALKVITKQKTKIYEKANW